MIPVAYAGTMTSRLFCGNSHYSRMVLYPLHHHQPRIVAASASVLAVGHHTPVGVSLRMQSSASGGGGGGGGGWGDAGMAGKQSGRLTDQGRLGAKAELRPYATVVPAADRLVVVGDVHGDIEALRSCLRTANLVDANDHWAGGDTVVVQVGDIFDRGNDDLRIEEWIHRLALQARSVDGAIYSIMGNHEVMNAAGDHSMATRKAFAPFDDLLPELEEMVGGDWSQVEGFPAWSRCRLLAMRPGGSVARLMSAHAVCMKVGDNLFVHAGLRPQHLRGAGGVAEAEEVMENMNAGAAAWLLGSGKAMPNVLFGEDSPVWTRVYSSPDSRDVDEAARAELEEVLRLTGTKRMLVGHTPQRLGINSAANGQIWRVDTGMTAMIGGRPEVLEIVGDEITVLTEYKSIPADGRACRPLPPASEMETLRRQ